MKKYFLYSIIGIGGLACKSKNPNDIPMPEDFKQSPKITTEESTTISRFWTSDEAYKIKRFVERSGWDAIQSETGLYCYVYSKKPSGVQAKQGDIAVVNFKIHLLDADTTLCYASEKGAPQDILIEMDNVESGLHEALTYLREGEAAYVVLPHYLAHGLVGDLDRIPPLSPVLYDIELVQIK